MFVGPERRVLEGLKNGSGREDLGGRKSLAWVRGKYTPTNHSPVYECISDDIIPDGEVSK